MRNDIVAVLSVGELKEGTRCGGSYIGMCSSFA